jgi:hypothetical protein
MRGHGTFTHANGDAYVGEWVDDDRQGHGTMTWADGDVYVGEWIANEFEGDGINTIGVFTSANGSRLGATKEQRSIATEVGPYGQIENLRKEDWCSIRRVSFKDGDKVMRIKHCGHIFFQDELTEWLQRKGTCPVCRHNICHED